MRFVPNAVSRKVARQILIGQKHSPTMLFVAGTVGVITAAVLASKATLKLEDILVDTQKDLIAIDEVIESENIINHTAETASKEKAYVYGKAVGRIGRLYAPAITIGTLSIAALTGSHIILTRRNVAVTAAYAALDKGFKEYRARVMEEYGPEKERELRYGAVEHRYIEETETGPQVKTVKRVDPNKLSIYARFFDQTCTPFATPEENRFFLECQQRFANHKLQASGHLFLNDVYKALGIPITKAGQSVGWALGAGGDNYIDFGVFDGSREGVRDFVNGNEGAILLDFNVDGVILDFI